MFGRRFGLLAGLALIVAQICCAPVVVARPACPMKYHGGCPMERQNTCRATAPQHATAVKPKPVAARITVQEATRQIALLARIYVLAVVTPALEQTPLDLVLRI